MQTAHYMANMALTRRPETPAGTEFERVGSRRGAEYRIRHTDTDLKGVVGTFENDREAIVWWSDYADHHPAVQVWEIVLERDDGGRRWASVAATRPGDASRSERRIHGQPAPREPDPPRPVGR